MQDGDILMGIYKGKAAPLNGCGRTAFRCVIFIIVVYLMTFSSFPTLMKA